MSEKMNSEGMIGDRWVPFSNGSEYDHWRFHNCERCKKDFDCERGESHCDLEQSIALGSLSQAEMDRIGWRTLPYKHLDPRCKELDPR